MDVNFELEGEYIPLDGLLKRCSLVASGAEAHLLVDDGKVMVNGKTEQRRRAKIRPGDTVQVAGSTIHVTAGRSDAGRS